MNPTKQRAKIVAANLHVLDSPISKTYSHGPKVMKTKQIPKIKMALTKTYDESLDKLEAIDLGKRVWSMWDRTKTAKNPIGMSNANHSGRVKSSTAWSAATNASARIRPGTAKKISVTVSYTHLTLPTICSV